MSEIVCERKKESAAYERDMMVFAFKEAEWKQEKKDEGGAEDVEEYGGSKSGED